MNRDVVADELRVLRCRLADLEEQVAAESSPEERSTRRGMLRLAGAAVVGGAAASLLGAQPAAAGSNYMWYGAGNNAGTSQTSLASSAGSITLLTTNSAATGTAVEGLAERGGTGVFAKIVSPLSTGYGVWASIDGDLGYGVVVDGGSAQMFLSPKNGTGSPSTGNHSRGEILFNAGGLFLCVTSGTPGAWRKLGGPATAGAFHALTPTRVYDSRVSAHGLINSGSYRTISVSHGINGQNEITIVDLVPAGATAVAANVTITGTTGGFGYLAINPGGNTVEGASTINWAAPGQTIANGVTLTLNAYREITVICNGGGSTHFIIDIAGYYL